MRFNAQSAMEYLITYSWAILIIILVFGVLFSLGIFNANTYSSKAQPGSCQVYRPYGPGTTQLITLQGLCNNIQPESVAYFNGQTGSITIPNLNVLQSNTPLTISIWLNSQQLQTSSQIVFMQNENYLVSGFRFGINPSNKISFWTTQEGGSIDLVSSNLIVNTWYNIVVTYNGIGGSIYVNGLNANNAVGTYVGNTNNLFLAPAGGTMEYDGMIANMQVYNTSLSANEINTLYYEGIGGAPLKIQNLVGWWPLNGNTNDYSGNGNNGVASSIAFISSWTQGYSVP